MLYNFEISSINYNGYIADITFYPSSGGTIYIGEVYLPFNYQTEYYYGTYNLYFPFFFTSCTINTIAPPTPTPTMTMTPSPLPPTIEYFQDCCDGLTVYKVGGVSTPIIVGNTYYITTDGFSGCGISVSGLPYNSQSLIITVSSYASCVLCEVDNPCPSPTPTNTLTPTPTPTPTICVPQMIYSGEKFINLPLHTGASFKPDGTILYISLHNGSPTDSVCAYSALTPWNVSTITLPRIGCSIAVPVISGSPTTVDGNHFSPDGSKLFVVEERSKSVFRYSAGTPWDVSTTTYTPGDLFTIVGLTPSYIDFSPDGLFMFLTVTGGLLKRYTLTTAWDISSGVTESQSLSGGTFILDFTFQNNGTYLFSLINSSGLALRRQTLAVAYDLTTINNSLTQIENIGSFISGGSRYTINFRDGFKGFIGGYYASSPNGITAFELTCEWDISGIVVV
jgi:hypothetical protein